MNSLRKFNGMGTAIYLKELGETKTRKCGWICRNLGKIGAVVSLINPAVGAAIIAVKAFMDANDIGFNFKNTNYGDVPIDDLPMNPQEEMNMDFWFNNFFTPFYKTLTQKVTELQQTRNILTANTIVEQIIIIKSFYAYHKGKQEGLFSSNATTNRSNIVDYLLNEQLKVIADSMTGFYQENTKIITANHSNLQSSLEINLAVLSQQIDGYQFTTEKTNTPVNTTSVVTTVSPTGVVSTNTSSNTKKIVGIGLIGLAVVLLLSGSKKSKSK